MNYRKQGYVFKKGFDVMGRQLNLELERAFKTKKFATVIMIESAIIFVYIVHKVIPAAMTGIPFLKQYIGTKTDFLPGALYYWIGLNNSMERSILFAILPIICAIPYGTSLYTDYITTYQNHFVIRQERGDYFFSKLIVLFLNGGMIAVFPFAVSLYLNSLILPFEETLSIQGYFSLCNEKIICSELFFKSPIIYCLIYLLFIFVGFGIINCICYIFTYILSGSAVILISPFIVYFTSFVLMEFFGGIPVAWQFMRFNQMKKDDLFIVTLQLLVLAMIPLIIAMLKSRKQGDII